MCCGEGRTRGRWWPGWWLGIQNGLPAVMPPFFPITDGCFTYPFSHHRRTHVCFTYPFSSPSHARHFLQVACLIRVPTEVVKSRMQAASYGSATSNSLQAAKRVLRDGGISGFYRGFGSTIAREVSNCWIIRDLGGNVELEERV